MKKLSFAKRFMALLVGLVTTAQVAMADDIPIVFQGEQLTTEALTTAPKGMCQPVEFNEQSKTYTIYPGNYNVTATFAGIGKTTVTAAESTGGYTFNAKGTGVNWVRFDAEGDYTLEIVLLPTVNKYTVYTDEVCIMSQGDVKIINEGIYSPNGNSEYMRLNLKSQYQACIDCRNLETISFVSLECISDRDAAVRLCGDFKHGPSIYIWFESPRGAITGIRQFVYSSSDPHTPHYVDGELYPLTYDAIYSTYNDHRGNRATQILIKSVRSEAGNPYQFYPGGSWKFGNMVMGHAITQFNKHDIWGDHTYVNLKTFWEDENGHTYSRSYLNFGNREMTVPMNVLEAEPHEGVSGIIMDSDDAIFHVGNNKLYSSFYCYLGGGITVDGNNVLVEAEYEDITFFATNKKKQSTFVSKLMPFKAKKKMIFRKGASPTIEYGTDVCDCPIEVQGVGARFFCEELNSDYREVTFKESTHRFYHNDGTECHRVKLYDADDEPYDLWVNGTRLSKKHCYEKGSYRYIADQNLFLIFGFSNWSAKGTPNLRIGIPGITVGVDCKMSMWTDYDSNIEISEKAAGTIHFYPVQLNLDTQKYDILDHGGSQIFLRNSGNPETSSGIVSYGGDLVLHKGISFTMLDAANGIISKAQQPGKLVLNENIEIKTTKKAIAGWTNLEMNEMWVKTPYKGHYDTGKRVFLDEYGNTASQFMAYTADNVYGLRLAQDYIRYEHASFNDKNTKISIENNEARITLNSDKIEYYGNIIELEYDSPIESITIELVGHNVLKCTDSNAYGIYCPYRPVYFTGDGSLEIVSEGGGIRCSNTLQFNESSKVGIDAKKIGIEGKETDLVIDNITTTINGGTQAVTNIADATGVMTEEMKGKMFDPGMQTYVESDRTPAKQLGFFRGDLDIILGTNSINLENCDDIEGDGSISYDPIAHKLILNNATIGKDPSKYGIISPVPLEIELHGHSKIKGRVEVSGDLKFTGGGRVDIESTHNGWVIAARNTVSILDGSTVTSRGSFYDNQTTFSQSVERLVMEYGTLYAIAKRCSFGENIRVFELHGSEILTPGVVYDETHHTLVDEEGNMVGGKYILISQTGESDYDAVNFLVYDESLEKHVDLRGATIEWPYEGMIDGDMSWDVVVKDIPLLDGTKFSRALLINDNIVQSSKMEDSPIGGDILPDDYFSDFFEGDIPAEYFNFNTYNVAQLQYIFTSPNGTAKAVLTTPVYFFVVNDEYAAMGIKDVTNRNIDTHIYDLQGRRVTPTQKGIYISNGKKFINK